MNSWHDLRIWLSGLLGALSLAAFVAATLMRARDRALQDEEPALDGQTLETQAPDFTREIEQGLAAHGRFV